MEGLYLFRSGKQYGPYSREQLISFAEEGRIAKNDLIWNPELPDWTPVEQVLPLMLSAEGKDNFEASTKDVVETKQINEENDRHNLEKKGRPGFSFLKGRKKHILSITALLAVFLVGIFVITHQIPATKSQEMVLGTMEVTSAGGIYEGKEVTIVVDSTLRQESFNLDVLQIKSPEINEDLVYSSDYFQLSGPLKKIDGDITVTFALPQAALKHPYTSLDDLSKSLFIKVEEDVFAPSVGLVTAKSRLPCEINLEDNTITTVFEVESAQSVLMASQHLVLPKKAFASEVAEDTMEQLNFRLVRYRYGRLFFDDHFRLNNTSNLPEGVVKKFIAELENQKRTIEQLGFSFSKRYSYPIEVYLKEMNADGYYTGGKFSDQRGEISINRKLFNDYISSNGQDKEKHWNRIVATAGHELLHLVQSLYEPRSPWARYHPFWSKPYLWLDEAIATWYEAEALGDPNYLAQTASNEHYFFSRPLLLFTHDEQEVTQAHGYGSSIYFRFLTNKYDKKLPSVIYNHVAKQSHEHSNLAAVNAAMKEYGTSTAREWLHFAENYINYPETVIQGLKRRPIRTNYYRIESTAVGDDFDISITRVRHSSRHEVLANELNEEGNHTLRLRFSQQNLTFKNFNLRIGNDNLAFAKPGTIKVSVESKGNVGLLVYAVAADGKVQNIASAPSQYLASVSDHGQVRSEVDIPGFSNDGFNEVRFIAINYDDSNALETAELIVEITYEPDEQQISLVGDYLITTTVDKIHYHEPFELQGKRYNASRDLGAILEGSFSIRKNEQGILQVYTDSIPLESSVFTEGENIRFAIQEPDGLVILNYSGSFNHENNQFEGEFQNYVSGIGLVLSGKWEAKKID